MRSSTAIGFQNCVSSIVRVHGVQKSSRNSSKPPSSDGPRVKARPKKPSSGRKPGGQPGHERHERVLVPPEKVHEVVPCIPKQCEACAGLLHGQDPEPHRHQVFELPPVEPIVTEYQQHALDCRLCNHRTMGKLPEGVSTRAFGPTVDAVVSVLMGVYRLTKRQVPELTRDLFGLQMSVGAVIRCQEAASAAVAQTVEDARSYAKQQPVKHADETGWREGAGRARAWLWTVVTTHVVVFMIHTRRNAEAAKELLGDWFGVLVTDRHGAYHWWPNCRRQFCWAHLKRDIQTIVEREGESGRIGTGMLDEVERMFTWWHRVGDGTLARSSFRIYMRTVQKRFKATAGGRGGGVPPRNEQDVRDAALAPPRPLDLRRLRRSRADEQWGRTGGSSRRHHPEDQLRNAFLGRGSLRGTDADHSRHAVSAKPPCSRLHACLLLRCSSESTRPLDTPRRSIREPTAPRRVGA